MSGLSSILALLSCIYFFSSADCLLDVSGECALSGLSYGGRMLPSQAALTQPWGRQKIFVFRTPMYGLNGFGMGGGSGRVWLSSGPTCGGSTAPMTTCPSREDTIPCMDTSIPCGPIDFGPPPAPSYLDSSPLVSSEATVGSVTITRPRWDQTVDLGTGPVEGWAIQYRQNGGPVERQTKKPTKYSKPFNERPGTVLSVRIALRNAAGYGAFSDWQNFTVPCGELRDTSLHLNTTSKRTGYAKVNAYWGFRTPTRFCGVKKQTISFQQLDRDNCSPEEGGDIDIRDPVDVDVDARTFPKRPLDAHSLFNVTVTVITMDNQETRFSDTIRSATSAPGKPEVVEIKSLPRNVKVFRWSALECGSRYGEIIDYEYHLVSRGSREPRIGTTTNLRVRLPARKPFTFKVRARTSEGYGDYSEPKTRTF